MMFTPCWPSAGPTGGAGFAWPPGIWSLMIVRTFFAMSISFGGACYGATRPRSGRLRGSAERNPHSRNPFCAEKLVDLLHLVEAELDRHLALEDVHEHLQLLLVGVHVDDLAVEVGQWARRDLHRL